MISVNYIIHNKVNEYEIYKFMNKLQGVIE